MKRSVLFLLCLIPIITAFAQIQPTAVDTLKTRDKFTKVIIYEDHTWEYWYLPKPEIDGESLSDHWDTETIHAYKDVPIATLSESVGLKLVDDTHHYVLPIAGALSSRYGMRHNRPHRGVDIPLSTGTPVKVAFDGIVRIAEGSEHTGGYGNLVIVRHPNGLETYYAHLSKVLVKEGEIVRAGESIGLGGSTGRSTGPHLHFETRYMGKAFDPERVIDFSTGKLRADSLTVKRSYLDINSHYGQASNSSVASQSSNKTKATYHTVKQGDTLGKIAKKYHTSVERLCKLNRIRSTTILSIGRKLRVR